jgi:hypothetical protein
MDIEGVRAARRRQPFEPFTIRLSDGRALQVPHSDFVAVGTRRVVVVAEDDSTSMIDSRLIVSLDTLPKKGGGGNGKRRRGKS